MIPSEEASVQTQKDLKSQINRQEADLLKKRCSSDKECSTDEVCAFNENDENHYCVSDNLYLGCLKPSAKVYRYIESVQENDVRDLQSCYDFARKLNNPEILYNYVTYKPKKVSRVLKETIAPKLKCGDALIVNLPLDSFQIECDPNGENCDMVPRDSIQKMIQENAANCKDPAQYYVEIQNMCDTESAPTVSKYPIKKGASAADLKFRVSCPGGAENKEAYKAVCKAFSMRPEDDVDQSANFDGSIVPQQCPAPVYLTPNLITDMAAYRLKKSNQVATNLESFNQVIEDDQEALAKKKAIQYMLEYQQKYGKTITYSEALEHVRTNIENAENMSQSCSNMWDSTKGLNRVPFLPVSSTYDSLTVLKNGDAFPSKKEVIDFVCANYTSANYPDYIIYFAESAANGNRSGKAYTASFEQMLKMDKISTDKWEKSPNNITLINSSSATQSKIDNYFNTMVSKDYAQLQDSINQSLDRLSSLQRVDEEAILEKKNNMDRMINLMNQKIRNSDYQSETNKKMIRYMYTFLIIALLATILYFIYMNYIRYMDL
jgi:uncharacterized protein YukE